MHMSDALISPVIGGSMYLLAGGSALGIRRPSTDEKPKLAIMGVMGAFVFSAQMLNFTIPFTGSSGHLTGGLLLAAVLGPQAALVVMASLLMIQALFFGDGGLLAYGCNLFNMGVIPIVLIYGLLMKPLVGKKNSKKNLLWLLLFAVISAELGAISVVVQTLLSAKTGISFRTFSVLMCGIHLPIGLIEGLITAAVLSYLRRFAPITCDLWQTRDQREAVKGRKAQWLISGLLIAAILGGFISLFASSYEDGLEWSLTRSVSEEQTISDSGIASWLARLQDRTALLPDYNLKDAPESLQAFGTTISGLSGIVLTFALTLIGGGLLRWRANRPSVNVEKEDQHS